MKQIASKIFALTLLTVVLMGCFAFTACEEQEDVSTELLISTLEKCGELTTIKLNYAGVTEYEDSGIDWINAKDFTMVYRATLQAGIDLEKVEIEVDKKEKTVWVTIPDAEIFDVNVDGASVEFYSKKIALFNFDSKEDAAKAIDMAEEEAAKEAVSTGVLKAADEQAETLIKGILSDVVPKDYEIKTR